MPPRTRKQRVQWFGPDMSVRSSITARLMETWAHSQAIYDLLGQTRIDTDRIKNVVVMGVNTFGWTFTNRNLAVPTDIPHLRLSAPVGRAMGVESTGPSKPYRGQRGRVLSGGHPGAQYRGHRTSRERRYGHQLDGHGAVLCRPTGRAARTGQPLPASPLTSSLAFPVAVGLSVNFLEKPTFELPVRSRSNTMVNF